jgi:sugar fermentation stimulation protein A
MIFDPPLAEGELIQRYKRFLADVRTDSGEVLTIHCPNTGAMTGANLPGSEVWYSTSDNPKRRYPHTLEVVRTPAGRIGVNTGRANRLVEEALEQGTIDGLTGYETIRREAAIPDERGRFDFKLSAPERPVCYVEVKNMTLAYPDGRGAFPDAISDRALKHLHALQAAAKRGERAVLLFCVQHTGISVATPADEIDPAYAQSLRDAARCGVEVLALGCVLERTEIRIDRQIPVDLSQS